MPQRDDDPVHPDYDGIQFQAVTDKSGVVVRPACGNVLLVSSFLTVVQAIELAADLAELIAHLRLHDPRSYAAGFFDAVNDDLKAAISDCDR